VATGATALSKMNMSKMGYRVVLMGPRAVGKTAIISQARQI
jgi:hypothetical protein